MTPKEAYEKYKNFDFLLSDRSRLTGTFKGDILYDLWQAVKEEATKQPSATGAKGELCIQEHHG